MCRIACLYTEFPVSRRKHIDTRCLYRQCYIIRQADGSFLICGDIETVTGCYGLHGLVIAKHPDIIRTESGRTVRRRGGQYQVLVSGGYLFRMADI